MFVVSLAFSQDKIEDKSSESKKSLKPAAVWAIFDNADKLTVYSLEHNMDNTVAKDKTFHGYPIIGETNVADDKTKTEIRAGIVNGLAYDGPEAKCFLPRHGVHAIVDGKAVDLVICFECYQIEVYSTLDSSAEPKKYSLPTSDAAKATLNKVLTDAKIALGQ